MTKKIGLILVAVALFAAILAWLFIESTKPLPGIKILQDGRNHIDGGTKTNYKSNPPTSGDHYTSWILKGVYTEPRADGNLVHSLEHGYIIMWYDCEVKLAASSLQFAETVYAQQTTMAEGQQGTPSAMLKDMPKSFSDGSCNNLKNKLESLYKKFGMHKLIVMPRAGMDSPIILTAWGRMEKLKSVDEGKIKEFINAFRDAGPESTSEQ